MVDDALMEINQFWRQWRAAMVAGLLVVFPLMLSVDRYIDDIDRSMYGRMNWDRAGRPLADWLFSVVNFGKPAVAVAPLHTMGGLAVLALAGVSFARAYGLRSPFWIALATVPLMAQPYGLQNLSYGFDALGMSLALALGVIAALLVQAGRRWWLFVAAVAALAVACSLYQPGANGFIPCAGFLLMAAGLKLLVPPWAALSLVDRVWRSAAAYALGLGLYRGVNALWFDHRLTSYASDGARFKPLNAAGLHDLLHDVVQPWAQIAADFGRWPVVFPLVLMLVTSVVLLMRLLPPHQAAFAVLAGLAIALMSPGALLAIQDTFLHKPRVMAFLGPLLMSLVLMIVRASAKAGWPALRWSVVPMAWLLVVFAYAYGHAFAAQATFEQGRLSRLIAQVSALQADDPARPIRRVAVVGVMPRSPVLINTARKFPLIDRLIPPLLDQNWTFGISQLALHGLPLERVEVPTDRVVDAPPCRASADQRCSSEVQLERFGQDAVLIHLMPSGFPDLR